MKIYDIRLDLIRTAATFLVVSVHFFLNSGYYNQPMEGPGMLVMTGLRMAFMVCVPLFLLLTGYLCRNKALTGRYYLGLVRILLTYALCGLVCQGVQLCRGDELDLARRVKALLDFSAAPYGWYVEMYVGLFLLIPFLNVLWEGLETRPRRKALIATLLAMTSVPALAGARFQLFPDWWMSSLYPLTYYFLGAYFGEYALRVSWRWGIPALLAAVAAGGVGAFWLAQGGPFVGYPVLDFYGPTVAISACLVLLMLLQIPADRVPGWLKLCSFCWKHQFYSDSSGNEMSHAYGWQP